MIKITIPMQVERAQEIGQWMNDNIGDWPENWTVQHGLENEWEVTVNTDRAATAVLLRWG